MNDGPPRCHRKAAECAAVARDRDRLRQVLVAGGGEPHVALAYLARAQHAEARADELGTRLALAERALRLALDRQPAKEAVAAWMDAVKEADE